MTVATTGATPVTPDDIADASGISRRRSNKDKAVKKVKK